MTHRGWLVVGVVAGIAAVAISVGVFELDVSGAGLTIVAATVMLSGLYAYVTRDDSSWRGWSTPVAPSLERTLAGPPPGETIEAALAQFRTAGWGRFVTGERLSTDLREAAVTSLVHFDGKSRELAEDAVDEGTWTDDGVAAAFVGDVDPPSRSIVDRIAAATNSTTAFERAIRHTVCAIANVGAEETVDLAPTVDSSYDGESAYRTTAQSAVDEGPVEVSTRVTGHWAGIGGMTLFAIGVGVFLESAAVVFVGIVGLGYVAFSQLGTVAPPASISLQRSVDASRSIAGRPVTVTVTLTNDGDHTVPDLRFVDGVPPGLSVVEGSPRHATALRPGGVTTVTYEVDGEPGTHRFDPSLVISRSISRSREREVHVTVPTTLTIEPRMEPLRAAIPLRTRAASFTGRVATSDGGEGIEFHSVREYRRNDPLNRIDWRRQARTGELATLQFRTERAVTVVLLIDARDAAYVSPPGAEGHALTRAIEAAGRLFVTLLDRGDTVGIAGIGADDQGRRVRVEPCWLPPGTGQYQRARGQAVLADHPQLSTSIPTIDVSWRPQLRELEQRFSSETQVVFLSPLCDGGALGIARWFEAHGYPVSVISLDPTGGDTSAQQLARVGRRVHVADVRSAGIPVVDWAWDESLDVALARGVGRGGGR